MFQHFLFTRFNLITSDWKVSKSNKPVLTGEWYKDRFQLFTDYCFSSGLAPSNKNFKWLVFFDDSTLKKYKNFIISKKEVQKIRLNCVSYSNSKKQGQSNYTPLFEILHLK